MAHEPITLRLAPAMLDRLERLAEKLVRDPAAAAAGRTSRQFAARLALARGLDALDIGEDLARDPAAAPVDVEALVDLVAARVGARIAQGLAGRRT